MNRGAMATRLALDILATLHVRTFRLFQLSQYIFKEILFT